MNPDCPSCCQRFAAYHDRPHELPASPALDLESMGRSRDDSAPVTVTARALLLTRDVGVQRAQEEEYDTSRGGFFLPPWHRDTTLGGLALEPALLDRWSADATPVLDLAAGLGLFATEAASLGVRVDCADLHLDDGHPAFEAAARTVAVRYPEQLDFLRCLALHGRSPRYAMGDDEQALLERLHAMRQETANRYPEAGGRRFLEDATTMASVPDDSYGAVLCGWLLVHLDEPAERRVVETAVRLCRPGGTVRIRAGGGGELAERFRGWWQLAADAERAEVAGKVVHIDAASHDDLLVLDTE